MIYEDKYLKFPDQATQEQYYKQDEDNPANVYPQLFWDVIGTIYEPGETEEDPPTPLPGWHVNVCYHFLAEWPAELDQSVITPPATPYRIRPVPELTPQRRATLDCTRLQGEIMLMSMGILEQVNAWVATQGPVIQAAYNRAYRWSRQSDLWELAKPVFGLTDWDLDRLFMRAREFKA